MSDEPVYVVGVGMHRVTSDPIDVREMGYIAGSSALLDAGLRFDAIDCVYNGYRPAADDVPNAVTIVKELGLTGVPITQVENASATGSVAFREAVARIANGEARTAMALGGAAARPFGGTLGALPRTWSGGGYLLPAAFFAMWAVRRMHDVGTTVETYAAIAAKNWNHARLNPYARRRSVRTVTSADVLASTKIAYPHTSMMSAATGGGAACAIVADLPTAKRLAVANSRPLVRVRACELASEQYVDGHIFSGAIVGPPELTATTAAAAYERAGVGPDDLSLVQVHDAFPVEELIYSELLGLAETGEGDRLVAEGATALGGRIPFSTDGGLIARGHPFGATGIAQIWELVHQLRGTADARQVPGARIGLAHMMGAGSVCAISILQRV